MQRVFRDDSTSKILRRKKNAKLDILKLRTFALRKIPLRKLKCKLQKSVSYIYDKGFVSKIHKELSILKSKKKN